MADNSIMKCRRALAWAVGVCAVAGLAVPTAQAQQYSFRYYGASMVVPDVLGAAPLALVALYLGQRQRRQKAIQHALEAAVAQRTRELAQEKSRAETANQMKSFWQT
jgi:hypothetical protein